MASKLVKARWIAPYEAQLSNGTVLVSQETVVEISEHEAEVSNNWEVLSTGKSAGPTKKDLKELAKSLGINVPAKAKKDEIEDLIAEKESASANGEGAEAPQTPAETAPASENDGSND
ncbi:MAG TPA: hypothetical protein VGC63_04905 [Solirubrobacterales bacterium]|jgi:hypothetical protein